MTEDKSPAIVVSYEIYLQDLSNEYIDLSLIGYARTKEEAIMCCRLFREALGTAKTRGAVDKSPDRLTVFFRPVLKEVTT